MDSLLETYCHYIQKKAEVVNRRSKIIKADILALQTVAAGLCKTLLLVTYSTAAIQSWNWVAGVEEN